MGRRRTGSTYEKPSGSGQWWYSFLLRSGKRWSKPVPARPDGKPITEADARAYKDEVLRRYESGAWDPEAPEPPAPAEVPTLAAYAVAWAARQTHFSAVNDRRMVEQHIVPSDLGPVKITEITSRMIAAWVVTLRAKPAPRGGTLAPTTVRGLYQVLHRVCVEALFEEVITSNPCTLPRGILPRAGDKDPSARRTWRYTREEVETLISASAIPHDRRVLYAILFLAGARRGEAMMLRWGDWDRARKPLGCLSIERAWSQATKVVKETKTGAVREIPVHPTLAAILAEWKLSGWERHVGLGRAPTSKDLVVPTRTNRRRAGPNIYSQLAYDAQQVGVRPRRVHGARHTFVSMLIDDGARPDLVAKFTHTRPVRSAFDVYRTEAWSTLCAEMMHLKIERRVEVLPLFRAVGAEDVSLDSATDSATTPQNTGENALKLSVAASDTLALPVLEYREEPSGNSALSSGVAKEREPIPGSDAPSGSDSATTGSDTGVASAPTRHPVGPHTGEAFAYLWVEAILARGEEP